ncbi:MAG: hypothetical protein LBS83_00275 [Holosporales bacterium]|nr:hypothetical protein [Holosporales bacterium]
MIVFYIFFLFLSGCQYKAKSPIGNDLTESDFKVLTSVPDGAIPLPQKQSVSASSIVIPESYRKRISLHISRSLPLDIALTRAGQMLGIDIQLDKFTVQKHIDFLATDKPFIDILENICSIAGIRYRICSQFLLIEEDTPFSKNYNVQFLNLTRQSKNNISSVTDIFSTSTNTNWKKSQATINEGNGSNTSIKMNSENNFWAELEASLRVLLGNANKEKEQANFTIHKQAGIISVYGTTEQHHCIAEFLEMLQKSATSQILIEAKVIQVALKEEFKNGIEWNSIGTSSSGGGKDGLSLRGGVSSNSQDSRNFFEYIANFNEGFKGIHGLNFVLNCLQKFGTTKTLSSPRLTVMNNQVAILKIAKNHVYFKMNYNKHFYTKSSQAEVSVGSDIQTVPIGLVMSVQPAIDPVRKSVILFLRPTISKLAGDVSDPSIVVANNANMQNTEGTPPERTAPESKVPVVEVKEIDSVLRLNDGEIAILGGLMETQSIQNQSKKPIVKIPLVKELFSGEQTEDSVTEIVILIRVKILENTFLDEADKRLVHLYATDPRPFF